MLQECRVALLWGHADVLFVFPVEEFFHFWRGGAEPVAQLPELKDDRRVIFFARRRVPGVGAKGNVMQ